MQAVYDPYLVVTLLLAPWGCRGVSIIPLTTRLTVLLVKTSVGPWHPNVRLNVMVMRLRTLRMEPGVSMTRRKLLRLLFP